MLNVISIVIGLFALLLAIPAFLPFFGWANWFMLPIAGAGALVGALSSKSAGRNFNLVLLVIGTLRLMLGGGIL